MSLRTKNTLPASSRPHAPGDPSRRPILRRPERPFWTSRGLFHIEIKFSFPMLDCVVEFRSMQAVALTRYLPISDPQSLTDVDLPNPVAGDQDIVVRVEAISVNPVDTKVRAPKEKVEKEPRVLGWDAAGVVQEVGAKAKLFKPGDEVHYAGDITRPGSNFQFQAVESASWDENLRSSLLPRRRPFLSPRLRRGKHCSIGSASRWMVTIRESPS